MPEMDFQKLPNPARISAGSDGVPKRLNHAACGLDLWRAKKKTAILSGGGRSLGLFGRRIASMDLSGLNGRLEW
jgi:hypothetical protein